MNNEVNKKINIIMAYVSLTGSMIAAYYSYHSVTIIFIGLLILCRINDLDFNNK